MLYKTDWPEVRQNYIHWWNRTGMILWLTADRPSPHEPIPEPARPATPVEFWFNTPLRISWSEYNLSRTEFLADSFPQADIQLGPGSLATFLGSEPNVDWNTVWYQPCIHDPETYGPITFNPNNNRWLEVHLRTLDESLQRAKGRWMTGLPDLIENLDTLAALRSDKDLFFDLVERPGWVNDRLGEINQAFFKAYDILIERCRQGCADLAGGSLFQAFNIWGPGKIAKVQCDISASLSPSMFRRFVIPHLDAQCRWLDHALYHLDGTTCLQHLEALLETESIDAIEWTPQSLSQPNGGDPHWYSLYRRIKAAGKGVQVIGVKAEEVIPLLDAIGPNGTYVMLDGNLSFNQAESLLKAVEPYRV